MLIVISPAKTLDFESDVKNRTFTQPDFIEDSEYLVKQMQECTPEQITELMHVSDKIAQLNYMRWINWQVPFTLENSRQAVFAFKGDVYTGLEIDEFGESDIRFAQKHLRILSGLYGVLRPLDLIQAYRLEMGIKLKTDKGKNLYDFWSSKLTNSINVEMSELKNKIIINLASQEYFKVLDKKNISGEIITPVFKDYKNGRYKIISFYAKKARGLMASYILMNRLTEAEQLQGFDLAGYCYNEELSKNNEPVFTRKLQA